ncbi:MAG: AN1-type zinc finger domain-containing protein [Candidatus Bathyarchaeia archaeon]
MKCQKCGQETFLPFKCPYCGNYFCVEHRLPENHECPRIEQALIPKEEAPPAIPRKERTYEYKISYVPVETVPVRIYFSPKEIKHLAIASLLVAGIGLSLGIFPENLAKIGGPILLVVFTLILTASFSTHEIAHKITAQRGGLWAEFRLTFLGVVLTALSIISPLFKIISPGAVMISGFADRGKIGKISIAGPLTNISLSTAFLTAAFLLQPHTTESVTSMFMFGAFFNAWIALLNLIPFGTLDGFKVFHWSKKNWVLAFTASLTLTIISYKFIG